LTTGLPCIACGWTSQWKWRYVGVADALPVLNICIVGSHDLDDASGPDAWSHVRGPMNFDFSYGRRHFVVLNGAPGAVGSVDIPADGEVEGPREEALTFLESSFESADAPHRVADAHAAISAGTTSRTPLALPAG
jgi:hypothetical protein